MGSEVGAQQRFEMKQPSNPHPQNGAWARRSPSQTRETAMNRQLPNPVEEPTITVPRAAAILRVDPRTLRAAIARDQCPVIRVGVAMRIPTAKFLNQYGLASGADSGA